MDLKEAIEKVLRQATQHRPFVFDVVTLDSAQHKSVANRKLRVSHGPVVELLDQADQVLSAVSMGPVMARAGMISGTAFAKTQYGNVTNDPTFHLLYDVQQRQLTYIQAGVSTAKSELSAPCMICGLVLPLRNLTVDHQRPQSGGEPEAVAITFRAFGLTNEGPHGPKGQKIMDHFTRGAPLSAVLTQPGRAALGGISVNARYTLNEMGTVLYSFVAAAGELERLKTNCMHGLMNLSPACGACNSSRGKQLKF